MAVSRSATSWLLHVLVGNIVSMECVYEWSQHHASFHMHIYSVVQLF